MNSCLYQGTVRHRRTGAIEDDFCYSLFMAYLDLDELPELFDGRWLWSARRPALAWFRRADYLGDPHTPLRDAVRELVHQRTGARPTGPIRLLTHLRYFGHCFNPVSFYYCFDAEDERVVAVVAHVTNTPWGERHAYVMPVTHAGDRGTVTLMRAQLDKQLHVSPLMGMDHVYDWRLTCPAERLLVHIESHRRRQACIRRDALPAPPRAHATLVARHADPLSPDHAAHRGAHLCTRPAAEAAWSKLLPAPDSPPAHMSHIARPIVLHLLGGIHGGQLTIVENSQRVVLGKLDPERPLQVTVQVRSPRVYRALLRGSVGLCQSYIDGLWECSDLVGLTRLAALNVSSLDSLRRVLAPVLIPGQRWIRWLRRNTIGRSREQIAAHYDLGNELFEQFLDPTMMYSCAVFDSPRMTLEQASLAKLERICSKLDLSPQDHVLEIGTGWGGFAVYAAEHHGCRVTTITISREQHAYACERVRAAGLQERVTVLLQDYRDSSLSDPRAVGQGGYDKLVSIEMIEAVGWQNFPTYFRRCSELLADDGAMLLQAIVIDDRAYEVEKAGRSFINTYIFPGGCLPSLEVISRSLARATDLRQVHIEDITSHYATTLARWRERFQDASERIAQLGYDERFRRLWELYLSYCEGGFRERRIRDVQLLLAKPRYVEDSSAVSV